jgi:PAS domain S-box-containing protein
MAATQIGTLFLDRSLRVMRYTPSVRGLFNLIPGDIGRPHAHVTHGLDYGGLGEDAAEVLRTLRTSEREVGAKDGRHFLMRLTPYRTLDDRIGGVVVAFIDITERRRAEEAVRASEGRLQRAINIETVGVIFLDMGGTFTGANDAFLRMSGYTREQVESRRVNTAEITLPEWAARTEEALEELKTEWRTTPYEKELRRPDGSRWWGLFAATRLDETEAVEYVIDVTERRRAAEDARVVEERLRLVVESVEDYAIFTTDAGGLIQSWNPGAQRTFGYTEREAVGRPIEIIFTPEDREQGAAEEEMRQARETGRAADERWHVGKHGARFYVSGVLAPLRDGEGRLTGYAKIARDLTERKELEDALLRAHDELEGRVRERTTELQEMTGELLEEVKERAFAEGRVRGLLSRLVTVQEEERRRIARELHDTLGQQLTGLRLSIDMMGVESEGRTRLQEHIERTRAIFDQLNSDVDFLAWELRPAALDHLGLDAALRSFVSEWSAHFGWRSIIRGPAGRRSASPPRSKRTSTGYFRRLCRTSTSTPGPTASASSLSGATGRPGSSSKTTAKATTPKRRRPPAATRGWA